MLSLIMNPHHMAMHTAPSSVGTHQLSRIFDTEDHESIYQFVHELEKFHNVFLIHNIFRAMSKFFGNIYGTLG